MTRNSYIWPSIFQGIEDGKKAFSGPHTAQIDLTDRCNNACIGCWVHSPHIKQRKNFIRKLFRQQKILPFDLVEKVIEELFRLGTREIFLAGSGEPFLHPQICDIIRLIKSKGMYLNIITNSTLIDEEISRVLVESRVDLITASVWAGTPQAYVATHPQKCTEDFQIIKKNLSTLGAYKRKCGSLFPHVKVYNVVCSKNYKDLSEMIDFGKQVDADSVEFQAVDIIKGATEFLTLDNKQIKQVYEQFDNVKKKEDIVFYDFHKSSPLKKITKNEFSDFGKLWKDYKKGFKVTQYAKSVTCPRGLRLGRDVSYCDKTDNSSNIYRLRYQFIDECKKCSLKTGCFDRTDGEGIEVNLLNILNVGTLLRRLSSTHSKIGDYDIKVNSIPCYIGWYFCRILTNGAVIPCCKAANFPLGNIRRNAFSKIWNSSKYRKFRFNALYLTKDDQYFSKIDCVKSCDNWGMNLNVHSHLLRSGEAIIKKHKVKLIKDNKSPFIEIMAKDFTRGNLNNTGNHGFGENLVIDAGKQWGYAEYDFYIQQRGRYELFVKYAALDIRPVELFLDGALVKDVCMANKTGGWTADYLKWHKEFDVYLKPGKHTFKLYSQGMIPHVERIAFARGAELSLEEEKQRLPGCIEESEKKPCKK